MDLARNFSYWFWDETFWFPVGFAWSDIQSTEFEHYPDSRDLIYPLFYAIFISLIRVVWEWSIARPLGAYVCGIEDTHSELHPLINRIKVWCFGTAPDSASSIHSASAGRSASQNSDSDGSSLKPIKPKSLGKKIHLVARKSTLDKFCESSWRGLYYSAIFVYGAVILYGKPWFWDTQTCWYGWPFQEIDNAVWWYYMIEAGFYWSLAFSQFVDVQRKDFWVNFIHHIATILLIYLSWVVNFVRVGALVLVVHDAADAWMEAAKMARYAKRDMLCNVFFVIFTLIWFATRVFIYPYKIIHCCMVESVALVGWSGTYYVLNPLMVLLLLLHAFWTKGLVVAVLIAIRSGKADDVRSDDEEEEELGDRDADESELTALADFDREALDKMDIDSIEGLLTKLKAMETTKSGGNSSPPGGGDGMYDKLDKTKGAHQGGHSSVIERSWANGKLKDT